MQKTNLLYVITKLELGGAQKHLLTLIRGIDQGRYRVFLFTAREGILLEEARALPGITLQSSRFLERPLHFFKDAAAFIELYVFIKKNHIAIVHTHSSKAGLIGRWAAFFAGVKHIVHTVHGWSFNDFQRRTVRRFLQLLERYAARVTARIIVVSEHDMRRGLRCGIGTPAQYALIPYGIDHSGFRQEPTGQKEAFGIAASSPVVTMVSCLKPQKAPEDFVTLASLVAGVVPEVTFLLVGDGVLRGRVESAIRARGLERRVRLLGWRRDIPALLSLSDVVVLTSRWEGFPIVVLESIVSMRPVVATDTGGINELVRSGETGFVVPVGDMPAMAGAVTMLLREARLRQSIAQAAYAALGDRFSLARMLTRTQQLYAARG